MTLLVLVGRRFAPSDDASAGPRPSALAASTAALLALSLLLGGAGDSYSLITLGIELGSLALLWYAAVTGGIPARPGLLPGLIVGGAIALPLLQLVPLPPALWQGLSGREAALDLLTLSGLAGGWRPISLEPGATIATSLEMLPALAMFLCVLKLGERDRLRLIWVAVAVGLLSALLGALQKAGGDLSPFILFETPHIGNSPGLFVNRNHQATFLLICMLLSAGAARAHIAEQPSARGLIGTIGAGLMLVFAAGVVVTTSRTGFLLLLPTLAASVLIAFPIRWNLKFALGGVAMAAGAAVLGLQSEAVQTTLARFSDLGDERTIYWSDTLQAIRSYWPFGSGLGTFPQVHAAVQNLDSVTIQFVNNAHNDHLELLLEGGALAAALGALGLVCWILSGVRLLRGGAATPVGAAAFAAIGVLLLHSIFDYPLRMLAIMSLFGLLWGLLIAACAPVPRKAR